MRSPPTLKLRQHLKRAPGIGWGISTLDCMRGREFAIQLSPGVGEFSI